MEDGLSTNTVNKAHALLKSVCREAVRRDDLAKSPFKLMDAPRRRPEPANSLTAESARELNAKLADLESNPMCMLSTENCATWLIFARRNTQTLPSDKAHPT